MLNREERSYLDSYIAWCEKMSFEELIVLHDQEVGYQVAKAIENRKKFRGAVAKANEPGISDRWRGIMLRAARVYYKISLTWLNRAEQATIEFLR